MISGQFAAEEMADYSPLGQSADAFLPAGSKVFPSSYCFQQRFWKVLIADVVTLVAVHAFNTANPSSAVSVSIFVAVM